MADSLKINVASPDEMGQLVREHSQEVSKLINHFIDIVFSKDPLLPEDREDAISSVYLYILDTAVDRYDPARSVTASTFIGSVARQQLMNIRKSRRNTPSLDQVDSFEVSYESNADRISDHEELERISEKYDEKVMRILELRFVQGCTLQEVADIMDMSGPSHVSHVITKVQNNEPYESTSY